MEWTSDFALGIDEIDEQHRALIGMINALDIGSHSDYRPETMRKLLAELGDYVRDHFALEERLMAGGGCTPELVTRHCGEHVYFRSVLKDITEDFESGRRSVTVTLIEYLVHWLLHHIVVVDRTMAQQLKAAEPALAARVSAAMLQTVVTDELTDSERHLLAELRRANEALEQQVKERTQALTEANVKLEADLQEMSALIQRLSSKKAWRSKPREPAAPPLRTALILFAHGAPDDQWAGPMHRVCAVARARAPELRVELAFLEFMTPGLGECAQALIVEGFRRVVVLPMFMGQGGNLKRDFPLLIEDLRVRNPQVRFEIASPIGEAESIVQAMATHALALVG